MPPLADTLRDSFRGTGDPARRSPEDASQEMGAALAAPAPGAPPAPTHLPPPPAIDGAALARLVARFSAIDLGSLDRAVAAVSGNAAVELPGADQLLARVQPLLRIVGTLRSDGTLALLAQLGAEPAEPTFGLAAIEASLGELLGARRSAAFTNLLDLTRGVFPVPLDVDGPIGRIGDALLSARDLVALIGAMMAIHTAATDLRDAAAMIDQLLAPETAAALIEQAQAWSEAGAVVAAVQAVSDPDDEAQVLVAADAVGRVTAALGELTDALARAMGFGEATLVHADPLRSTQAIGASAAQLLTVDPRRIRASTEALAALVARVLPPDAVPAVGLDDTLDAAADFSAQLVTAVASLSAAPLIQPVQQGLGAVTSAIHEINRAFGEVSAAIRGALAAVRAAVASIDLQAIAREVTRLLQPLVDAIRELDELLHTIATVITDTAAAITAAIAAVTGVLSTGAGHVTAGFDAVHDALTSLDLGALIDGARAGIGQVRDEL